MSRAHWRNAPPPPDGGRGCTGCWTSDVADPLPERGGVPLVNDIPRAAGGGPAFPPEPRSQVLAKDESLVAVGQLSLMDDEADIHGP